MVNWALVYRGVMPTLLSFLMFNINTRPVIGQYPYYDQGNKATL
jgi:hypothetical protein